AERIQRLDNAHRFGLPGPSKDVHVRPEPGDDLFDFHRNHQRQHFSGREDDHDYRDEWQPYPLDHSYVASEEEIRSTARLITSNEKRPAFNYPCEGSGRAGSSR